MWKNQEIWDGFVDIATIIWLILFALSFFELDPVLNQQIDQALLAILPVFVADLIVKYLRVRDLRGFLRSHWLDILATIPYFRFLRIARISRAIRLVKVTKSVRSSKAVKTNRILKWIKKTYNALKAKRKVKKMFQKSRTQT